MDLFKFRSEQQVLLEDSACQETLKEAELLRIKRRLRGDMITIFKYEKMLKEKGNHCPPCPV